MPVVEFTLKRVPDKKGMSYDIVIQHQPLAQNIPVGVGFHIYVKDKNNEIIESTVVTVKDTEVEFEEEKLLNEHNDSGC